MPVVIPRGLLILHPLQESFTFDQGDFRARKVSLVLFDAPRPGERGWGTQLGIALIPVPAQGAPPVDIGARETLQPVAGAIIEGWFPFSQRSAEADYEASDDGLPNGEVFARVSFAQRRADSGYCEQVRVESPVAQPVDSYSNFLFLCTGTHMVAVGAADFARARAARAGVRTPMMSGMQRFPVYSIGAFARWPHTHTGLCVLTLPAHSQRGDSVLRGRVQLPLPRIND